MPSRPPSLGRAEKPENYGPGGYCPVDIGSRFQTETGTYTVLHKLGFGPSSTVWLVRRDFDGANPSLYALKILRADVTASGKHGEFQTLAHFDEATAGSESRPGITSVRFAFRVASANGEHSCLVHHVYGPSLINRQLLEALSSQALLHVCKHVALAVTHLHAHGICHGDVSPEHILLKLPAHLSPADFTDILGDITTHPFPSTTSSAGANPPHHPRALTDPATFHPLLTNPPTLRPALILIGFGKSFLEASPRFPIPPFPPSHARGTGGCVPAPETLFGRAPARASDVWQLACAAAKALTRETPFAAPCCSHRLYVGLLVRYLGPVPGVWRGRFLRGDSSLGGSGSGSGSEGGDGGGSDGFEAECAAWFDGSWPRLGLWEGLDREGRLRGEEGARVRAVLEDMFAWEPERRPSAAEVYGRFRRVVRALGEEEEQAEESRG